MLPDLVENALAQLARPDLGRAARVCRAWRAVASADRMWARFARAEFPWHPQPTRAWYAAERYSRTVKEFVGRGFKPFVSRCYVYPERAPTGPPPTRFDPAEVAALVNAAPSPVAASKARDDFFRFHFCPACHNSRTGIRDVVDRPGVCRLCVRKARSMVRVLLPLAGLGALID